MKFVNAKKYYFLFFDKSKKNFSASEILREKHFLTLNYIRDDQGQFIVSITINPKFKNLSGDSREFDLNLLHKQEIFKGSTFIRRV